jgi:hypothetical protein
LIRQINQRNNDGKCADHLADCTNRFPIHITNCAESFGRCEAESLTLPACSDDSAAIYSAARSRIGNQIDAAFIFARVDFVARHT